MEQALHTLVFWTARLAEAVATLVIAYAIVEAIVRLLVPATRDGRVWDRQRAVFRRFGRWLVLALEFTIAGDLVKTAAAPTWDDIGQLAAIAAIRTFLNYFLERDLEKLNELPERPRDAATVAAPSEFPPARHV